jgi:transcriptional regulator with XRE-family HTH domain
MTTGTLQMTFGEWIVMKRKALGEDGKECAARAGMSPQLWSRWENDGKQTKDAKPAEPKSVTMQKIAKGLKVPVEEVLAAAYPDTSEPEQSMLRASAETAMRFIDIPLDGPMTIFKDGEKMTVELRPEDRALLENHTALLEAFLAETKKRTE